ncbi:YEATS family protein [Prunus dulcis]|uniref:YEATS family protein n=1 Tax=Prunus dulcis TaxID=3755 RepID=A0A4Y1RW72_PRUDU|nr:YEATS family protein [Prunus dulcis]
MNGTNRRLKDVEICVPIVYGTIAFYLGRKASHSPISGRFMFVGQQTKTLGGGKAKCGWGEFEISISLFFHSDVCERQLDLFHPLKLYTEDESGPQSTKKPVVMESYNELVFPDPSEAFVARVQNHPAVVVPRLPAGFNLPNPESIDRVNEKGRGDTKDHPLSQWFLNFSEPDELLKLAAARQEVQAHIVNVRRKLSMLDGVPQLSKPPSGYEYT